MMSTLFPLFLHHLASQLLHVRPLELTFSNRSCPNTPSTKSISSSGATHSNTAKNHPSTAMITHRINPKTGPRPANLPSLSVTLRGGLCIARLYTCSVLDATTDHEYIVLRRSCARSGSCVLDRIVEIALVRARTTSAGVSKNANGRCWRTDRPRQHERTQSCPAARSRGSPRRALKR